MKTALISDFDGTLYFRETEEQFRAQDVFDILFFRSDESSRVSHTGIYVGGGMMIDASSGNGKVVKRSVSAYWKRNFVNARRPW